MGAAKTASGAGKRNSQNKRRVLYVNGENKIVTPIWYGGSRVGHGNYMAGQIDGVTVEAANGRPIPFRQIGTVEFVWFYKKSLYNYY